MLTYTREADGTSPSVRSKPHQQDRLVLLGTSGGAATAVIDTVPPTVRCGISSLLVVAGRLYLIDAGQSAARQLSLADPLARGSARVMADLEAIFITHLHSDHVMDVFNVVLGGYEQGWPDHSVPVVGPGQRVVDDSEYPQSFPPGGSAVLAPGTHGFVSSLVEAYQADALDRQYGSLRPPLGSRVHGVDIDLPKRARSQGQEGPSPFVVFEDDRVRVSATLVSHGRMFPAFAYRFDTPSWSVVFSGDTAPSENLIDLAANADVLVHEAIHPDYGRLVHPRGRLTQEQRERAERVLAKHTRATEVGLVAQEAHVGTLVLSHLVPGHLEPDCWRGLVSGFEGELVIGEDLWERPL
jgi:ribonuclease BN (tRNA processing enzyme)